MDESVNISCSRSSQGMGSVDDKGNAVNRRVVVSSNVLDLGMSRDSLNVERYLRERAKEEINPMDSSFDKLQRKAMEKFSSRVSMSKIWFTFEETELELYFIAYGIIKYREFKLFTSSLITAISSIGCIFFLLRTDINSSAGDRVLKSPFFFSVLVCCALIKLLASKDLIHRNPFIVSLISLTLYAILASVWIVGLTISDSISISSDLLGNYTVVMFAAFCITSFSQSLQVPIFITASVVTIGLIPSNEGSAGRVVFGGLSVLLLLLMAVRYRDWHERIQFVHHLMLLTLIQTVQVVHGGSDVTILPEFTPGVDSGRTNISEETSTARILLVHEEDINDLELANHFSNEISSLLKSATQTLALEIALSISSSNSTTQKLTKSVRNADLVMFLLSSPNWKDGNFRNVIDYAYESRKEILIGLVGDISADSFPSGMKLILRSAEFIKIPKDWKITDVRDIASFITEYWLHKTADGKRILQSIHEERKSSKSKRKMSHNIRDAVESLIHWTTRSSKGSSSTISSKRRSREIELEEIEQKDPVVVKAKDLSEEKVAIDIGSLNSSESPGKASTVSYLPPMIKFRHFALTGTSFFASSRDLSFPQRKEHTNPLKSTTPSSKSLETSPSGFSGSQSVRVKRQRQSSIMVKSVLQPIRSRTISNHSLEMMVEVVFIDGFRLAFKEKRLENAFQEYRHEILQQDSVQILMALAFLFLSRSIILLLSFFDSVWFVWLLLSFIVIIPIFVMFVYGLLSSTLREHSSRVVFATYIFGCTVSAILHAQIVLSSDASSFSSSAAFLSYFELFISLLIGSVLFSPSTQWVWSACSLIAIIPLAMLFREFDSTDDLMLLYGLLGEILFAIIVILWFHKALNKTFRLLFLLEQRLAWEDYGIELQYESYKPVEANEESLKIFISYKREDIKFASKLTKSLRKNNFEVWIDEDIRAGQNWRDEVCDAIDDSSVVLFLVSPASVESKYCKEELEHAHGTRKTILPVVLSDASECTPQELLLMISNVQWVSFENRSFRRAFNDLLKALIQLERKIPEVIVAEK